VWLSTGLGCLLDVSLVALQLRHAAQLLSQGMRHFVEARTMQKKLELQQEALEVRA